MSGGHLRVSGSSPDKPTRKFMHHNTTGIIFAIGLLIFGLILIAIGLKKRRDSDQK
jgi:hypothetical protein